MDPKATISYEGGAGIITISNGPMNALHPKMLAALFDALEKCHADPRVKGIVVTGAGKNFSAGFDITLFAKRPAAGGTGLDGRWVNERFNALLESGPKPTVAAIDGLCLGGGLEASMACNARVATAGATVGLPELQLGIIPGFGGTQRMPRLVGVQKGLEYMLLSKKLRAAEALKAGLVCEVVPSGEQLVRAAAKLAVDMAEGRKPKLRTLFRTDRLEPFPQVLAVCDAAAAQAAANAPHVDFPRLCVEAVRHGVENGGLKGIDKEQENFKKSEESPGHKGLIHIFFATRATKRVRGVTDSGLKPRPMKTVAVIGGGLMGSGIATALILAGYRTILKEVNDQFLKGGLGRVEANVKSRMKKGAMKEEAARAALALLEGTLDYDKFRGADMVIEAALEDVKLKQQIFADLERACPPHCLLSTNTSTIDISLVGARISPEARRRLLGAHFFSPAHVMPLLEIVKTNETSPQALLDTLELSSRIKKTPVVVGNCTGFAVNRVFFPYTMGAVLLVDLGCDPYRIDKAIARGFGMPMGPFRLSDLVGGDIGLHVGANFVSSFPERVYQSRLIPLMNEAKRLGEKTGKGFYKFDGGRKASPDPEIAPIVQRSVEAARQAGLAPQGGKLNVTDKDIIEMVFFPVVNEGCRVVAEGVVEKADDLDVASVMAMGFPAYRGGLIFWADTVGPAYIAKRLGEFAAAYPAAAGFYRPCEYLARCAAEGKKLAGNGMNAAAKM